MIEPTDLSHRDLVLAGGGEMGALMRAYDWSATSVGAVAHWPQSLRTAVSMVLASGYPMYIAWGREFVQFYNDAYRPIWGDKHPGALGQRTPDSWSELWPMIGPMFQQVMAGEEVSAHDLLFVMERHGFTEESYFDFSYSPIRDESGGVGGVFVTCSETTGRVIGERRLKALRDLAGSTARAATAAEACRCAAEVLSQNQADVPFALLYLLAEDGTRAVLAGCAGLDAGDTAAPASLDLAADTPDQGWPLRQAMLGGSSALVDDLPGRWRALPGGPWPESPRQAFVLPISQPGQGSPTGALIAGISPRLAPNVEYRSFLELVAGQAATAIGNARAHEEERRRADALAELDRAKTAFFSNVSHEFRTPLSLLLGPVEDGLADQEAPLPQRQRERFEMARRNGLRLLKLVNTLLDFSRIEAGRVRAAYEPVDLAACTREVASSFRSAIENVGLRFRVDCDDLPQPVFLDREMWEKIVLNLLSNAFKFTFEGEILVSVKLCGDVAELTVRDTGMGIAEAELPRLFERFYRVQGARARTQEGSGIGLALVLELVRLHGGSIDVASRLGEGTTFMVRLPFGSDHLPPDRINARGLLDSTSIGAEPYLEEALRGLPAQHNGRAIESGPHRPGSDREPAVAPARILIADDNADLRDYLAHLLSRLHDVEVAADGQAALQQARVNPPDLVLADVMMPGLDGFQLLSALRADPSTRLVPVVLLSARAGEDAKLEGLEAGADDYLVKPFTARELLARVNSNLELSRLRREATRLEQAAREQAEFQREQLRQLFQQAPALMCIVAGPDHVFTLANAKYLQVIGNRPVLGKSLREALPELEGQGFIELLEQVYASGQPIVGRQARALLARGPHGSLEETYFDFIYAPVRDPRGEIEGVFVHGFDVTELVHGRQRFEAIAADNARLYVDAQQASDEAARQRDAAERARQAAEASRRHLDAILAGMADGVTAQAPDGRLVYANEAVARMMGLESAAQLLRTPPDHRFDRLEIFDERGAPFDPAGLPGRQAMQGIVPSDVVLRYRLRDSGNQHWAMVKARPVLDDDGRVEMVISISEDITEIKELDRQRQAFLAAAAHDLRTPLTSIRGLSQLVRRRLARLQAEDAQTTELLTGVESSTRKMSALIDELLDVSRLASSGDLVLNRSATDLTSIARQVIAEQQTVSRTHQLRLVSEAAGIVGQWDAHRVERVISNLVGNAIKFSPYGGDVVVTVREQRESGQTWAVLSIQDAGLGIRTEDFDRIFERFERGADVGQTPGSGIGLAYVRDVALQHGGTISVTSTVGKGSTFTLRLPLSNKPLQAPNEPDHAAN